MSLKSFLKPILWDSMYAHMLGGFIIAGVCSIFMPLPWPVLTVLALASFREGLQQIQWPWKHEPQTFRTMFANAMEFVAGAAMADLLAGFLRTVV